MFSYIYVWGWAVAQRCSKTSLQPLASNFYFFALSSILHIFFGVTLKIHFQSVGNPSFPLSFHLSAPSP
jgi:hypothetical protein